MDNRVAKTGIVAGILFLLATGVAAQDNFNQEFERSYQEPNTSGMQQINEACTSSSECETGLTCAVAPNKSRAVCMQDPCSVCQQLDLACQELESDPVQVRCQPADSVVERITVQVNKMLSWLLSLFSRDTPPGDAPITQ